MGTSLLSSAHCVAELQPAGGETIKNINQQSGAHVELQRNPPPNTDPNHRIFSIRGSPQQIGMARQLIDEKIGVKAAGRAQGHVLNLRNVGKLNWYI